MNVWRVKTCTPQLEDSSMSNPRASGLRENMLLPSVTSLSYLVPVKSRLSTAGTYQGTRNLPRNLHRNSIPSQGPGFKLSWKEKMLPPKKSLFGGVVLYNSTWSFEVGLAVLNTPDWSITPPIHFSPSISSTSVSLPPLSPSLSKYPLSCPL